MKNQVKTILALVILSSFSALGQVRINGEYYKAFTRPSLGYFDFDYSPLNGTIGIATGFDIGDDDLKRKPFSWFSLGGYFGIPTAGNADGISSSAVLTTITNEMDGDQLISYDYSGNDGGYQFGARLHLNVILGFTESNAGGRTGWGSISWLSLGGRALYHMPMVATYGVNSEDLNYYYYQFIDVPYRDARWSFAPEAILNFRNPLTEMYGVYPGFGYCYQPQPVGDPLHTFILRVGIIN